MLSFGKSGFRAGCRNCFINYDIVAKCGNLFLCNGCAVTARAMLSFFKTGFRAGCRNRFINYDIVTKCINLTVNITVSAEWASMGCISSFGTGRFCYDCFVLMFKRINGFCFTAEFFSADRAINNAVITTGLTASGSSIILNNRLWFCMTESRLCFGIAVAALAGESSDAVGLAIRRCCNHAFAVVVNMSNANSKLCSISEIWNGYDYVAVIIKNFGSACKSACNNLACVIVIKLNDFKTGCVDGISFIIAEFCRLWSHYPVCNIEIFNCYGITHNGIKIFDFNPGYCFGIKCGKHLESFGNINNGSVSISNLDFKAFGIYGVAFIIFLNCWLGFNFNLWNRYGFNDNIEICWFSEILSCNNNIAFRVKKVFVYRESGCDIFACAVRINHLELHAGCVQIIANEICCFMRSSG